MATMDDPKRLKPVVDSSGVLLMKRLSGATASEGPRRLLDQMTAYPLRQSVAFWHIGDRLGRQREIKDARGRAGEISRSRSRPSGVWTTTTRTW